MPYSVGYSVQPARDIAGVNRNLYQIYAEFRRLRHSLVQDDVGGPNDTLSETYDRGLNAAAQTLSLLDSKGGGLVVDGSSPDFSGSYSLEVKTAGGAFAVERSTGLPRADAGAMDFGDGQAVAVSASERMRLRYNHATLTGQLSIDGAAYVDIGNLTGSISNDQVAVGASTANTIEGSSALTFDGTTLATTGKYVAPASVGHATPVYTFLGDTNSGLFHGTGDVIGLSVGGNAIIRARAGTLELTPNGSTSTPSVTWASEAGLGIYRITTQQIGIASNSTLVARFDATGIKAANGAYNTPSYSFLNDTDAGLSWINLGDADPTVRMSVNGEVYTAWGEDGEGGKAFYPPSDDTISLGTANNRWSDLWSVLVSGSDFHMGGPASDGEWWLREGADGIYAFDARSKKSYRLAMEEVAHDRFPAAPSALLDGPRRGMVPREIARRKAAQ